MVYLVNVIDEIGVILVTEFFTKHIIFTHYMDWLSELYDI